VVYEHLEEQRLSFLADEIVHGLIDFHSVLYSVLGCLDEAGFGLIAGLLLVALAQLV
jgi:hypothetical protein